MSRPNLRLLAASERTDKAPSDDIQAMLREDSERALSKMLTAYGGLVFSVAQGILSTAPREELEECVSDAFLYIFENRQRLDFTKGSVKAYLCAAVRNRAYDRLRELQRRQRLQEKVDAVLPTPVPSAEELALLRVDRERLISAILALGEPDSTILICRYYLALKSSEIAKRTGLKPNTVDQRAGRALKKLARSFRKGEPHAADAE